MDQLTPFERSLLEQFKELASEFDQSQSTLGESFENLEAWLRTTSTRQAEIETRLTQLEATTTRLSDALRSRNASTEHLIEAVTLLSSALTK